MSKLSHRGLMDLGKVLEYSFIDIGLCRGFSCMWAQAVLAGDEASFFERLDFIASYEGDFIRLSQDIAQAKTKVIAKEVLNEQNEKCLQVLAFLDGIRLYLNPDECEEGLFAESFVLQNNLKTIYPVARSEALEHAELEVVLDKPYAFSQEELTAYLKEMADLLSKTRSACPILLTSSNHTVCLTYNKETKKWHYIDINDFHRYASPSYVRKLSLDKTVSSIFHSLSGSSNVVFTTTVLTSRHHQIADLKESFLTFSHYPIRTKLAFMYDSLDVGLLYLACCDGHLAYVQELLNKERIDINKKEVNGVTSLYIACQNGHLAVVRELLKEPEIEINLADNNDTTPLWIACQGDHLAIVLKLLNKEGIKVNKANKEGVTPLSIACQEGYLDIVRELLEQAGIKVNKADNNDETPLWIACQEGHLAIVRELLAQERIKVNQANKNSETPLWIACQEGHLAIVQELLREEGIEVNQANKDGITPLSLACENGYFEIVQELLEQKGIEINQADSDGITPLYIACYSGREAIVGLLLNQKAIEIETIGPRGQTPLQVACFSSDTHDKHALFELLLNNQASLTHQNALNQRALDIALEQNNTAALTVILKFIHTHAFNPCKVMSSESLTKAIVWSKHNLPEVADYLLKSQPHQSATQVPVATLFAAKKNETLQSECQSRPCLLQ